MLAAISIATVRPSYPFPYFRFICTSVSESDLGLKNFLPLFCLTHFLCLKYPELVQCLLCHLDPHPCRPTEDTDLLLHSSRPVASYLGPVNLALQKLFPQAWKRRKEKKLTSFLELTYMYLLTMITCITLKSHSRVKLHTDMHINIWQSYFYMWDPTGNQQLLSQTFFRNIHFLDTSTNCLLFHTIVTKVPH